jgi:hypothetical protein
LRQIQPIRIEGIILKDWQIPAVVADIILVDGKPFKDLSLIGASYDMWATPRQEKDCKDHSLGDERRQNLLERTVGFA